MASSNTQTPSTRNNNIYINPHASTHTYNSTSSISTTSPTLIKQYHQSLPGFSPTPLHNLPALATDLNVKTVLIKSESQRLTLPSFKILGASWGVYRALCEYLGLEPDPREVGVEKLRDCVVECRARTGKGVALYAATDGNHGRAVARMARILLGRKGVDGVDGVDGSGAAAAAGGGGEEASSACVIFVPEGMYESTKKLIRSEGAEVVTVQGDYDEAVRQCWEASKKDTAEVGIMVQDNAFEGYTVVPQWIVEGYATLLQEVDEQFSEMIEGEDGSQDITHVVTPIGVGSLGHAVVKWAKSADRKTKVRVIAVEPETAACLNASLKMGRCKTVETVDTIMSGMCCGTVSPTSWELLRDGVDVSVTVGDWEAHQAVLELEDKYAIEAGPCGAGCLAGLRQVLKSGKEVREKLQLNEKSVVVLLSTEGKRDYPVPESS